MQLKCWRTYKRFLNKNIVQVVGGIMFQVENHSPAATKGFIYFYNYYLNARNGPFC